MRLSGYDEQSSGRVEKGRRCWGRLLSPAQGPLLSVGAILAGGAFGRSPNAIQRRCSVAPRGCARPWLPPCPRGLRSRASSWSVSVSKLSCCVGEASCNNYTQWRQQRKWLGLIPKRSAPTEGHIAKRPPSHPRRHLSAFGEKVKGQAIALVERPGSFAKATWAV